VRQDRITGIVEQVTMRPYCSSPLRHNRAAVRAGQIRLIHYGFALHPHGSAFTGFPSPGTDIYQHQFHASAKHSKFMTQPTAARDNGNLVVISPAVVVSSATLAAGMRARKSSKENCEHRQAANQAHCRGGYTMFVLQVAPCNPAPP
jgi:hypothetical protein